MKGLFEAVAMAAVVIALGWSPRAAAAQGEISYDELASRMIDLTSPAVLPAEGETCKQWSSWDRNSKYDEASGKYIAWAANNDGPNFIRQEGNRVVMAEMEGPGCIWRIWSALAKEGRVKIYLDGTETPAVDLPFKSYFSGDTAPFNYPLLSYDLAEQGSRGQNLYFPIPYQKSCKIVAEEGWGRYYQFVYTTYPEGAKVPTFSTELAAQNAPALEKVNAFLRDDLGKLPPTSRLDGRETIRESISVEPGGKVTLELTGPRAILAMRGKMAFKDREDEMAALRKLVLRITWDGQKKPAVWCPLGDFLGTAPGANPYKSLPTGITEDGGYAFWYMPFARSALIEVINEDTVPRQGEVEIVHAPLPRPFDGLGHFHCKWHRDVSPLSEDRWPDWVMLRTRGRGRFCGVMLHVWNPQGGWWGEGDEKLFVDGEKYPSTFGTGSEDYFGYAWGDAHLFGRPYHCQTMTQGNRGHQSLLRWQIVDNVPFQESFEGCIEKYFRTEEKGTLYACVACWYLSPDGVDPYEPVQVAERHGYYVSPPIVAGGFKILSPPPGNVRTQGMSGFAAGKWKDDDHLWWTGAKPGHKLDIALPVKQDGTYELSAVLTKARDYGVVQLYVNGKKAGEPIDLYSPDVVNTEPISLGTHELSAGQHKLTVQIVGANEKAVPSYMFGIDYVTFDKK